LGLAGSIAPIGAVDTTSNVDVRPLAAIVERQSTRFARCTAVKPASAAVAEKLE